MAQQVAEAGAGDEQHGVRDGVAGDDELQAGAGGVQVETDGRRGDVDDGHVEDRHELTGEDDGEEPPEADRRTRRRSVEGDLGHAASLRPHRYEC